MSFSPFSLPITFSLPFPSTIHPSPHLPYLPFLEQRFLNQLIFLFDFTLLTFTPCKHYLTLAIITPTAPTLPFLEQYLFNQPIFSFNFTLTFIPYTHHLLLLILTHISRHIRHLPYPLFLEQCILNQLLYLLIFCSILHLNFHSLQTSPSSANYDQHLLTHIHHIPYPPFLEQRLLNKLIFFFDFHFNIHFLHSFSSSANYNPQLSWVVFLPFLRPPVTHGLLTAPVPC